MKFEERQSLIRKLNSWELKYPTEKWIVNGVHIWPLLKMRIFNNAFHKTIKNSVVKKSNRITQGLKLAIDIFVSLFRFLLFKIKESELLFAGGKDHRVVDKNNESFNRYFDPLMDEKERKENQTSILLEYNSSKGDKNYRNDRVVSVTNLFSWFLFVQLLFKSKSKNNLEGFNNFFEEMELDGFNARIIQNTVYRQTLRINAWRLLFRYIIKRTKAKEVFGLCYYANPVYGLILAAKELKIPSYDMQHGTQGPLHPAYTFYSIPQGGFNILPNYFYCWDQSSVEHILTWSLHENVHQPILFGNPWNDYAILNYKKFTSYNLDEHENILVITLQPLKEPISEVLFGVITSSVNDYTWWVRFHPRMRKSEIEKVKNQFSKRGISEKIIFDDSNLVPLPVLFVKAKLHFSRYSGSIIEAASLGLISLVLDEIGISTFNYLINEKLAIDASIMNQKNILVVIKENILECRPS